jgi:hypothetical protein
LFDGRSTPDGVYHHPVNRYNTVIASNAGVFCRLVR